MDEQFDEQIDPDSISEEEWQFRDGMDALAEASSAILNVLEPRLSQTYWKELSHLFAQLRRRCTDEGRRCKVYSS